MRHSKIPRALLMFCYWLCYKSFYPTWVAGIWFSLGVMGIFKWGLKLYLSWMNRLLTWYRILSTKLLHCVKSLQYFEQWFNIIKIISENTIIVIIIENANIAKLNALWLLVNLSFILSVPNECPNSDVWKWWSCKRGTFQTHKNCSETCTAG